MISRRNIRVKVMQSLYALETSLAHQDTLSTSKITQQGLRILNEKIENSSDLFNLMLIYLSKIAQFAETDAHQRGAKYLTTEEDRKVNIKIAGNNFLWELLDNPQFNQKIKEDKLERLISQDWIKKIFRQLAQSEEYQTYISEESRNPLKEKNIIKHIWYKEMWPNENFIEFISDEWTTWEDDKEMLLMLFDNFFKNQKNINFSTFISEEKKEFAHSLLETVLEKEDYVMELIQPKFKNWETERIAIIDLAVLKMGVCELLYFPTIPTKVTINEYIEIAKAYSTDQSGQFVNGVLDNILKDLTKEDAIRKTERNK